MGETRDPLVSGQRFRFVNGGDCLFNQSNKQTKDTSGSQEQNFGLGYIFYHGERFVQDDGLGAPSAEATSNKVSISGSFKKKGGRNRIQWHIPFGSTIKINYNSNL